MARSIIRTIPRAYAELHEPWRERESAMLSPAPAPKFTKEVCVWFSWRSASEICTHACDHHHSEREHRKSYIEMRVQRNCVYKYTLYARHTTCKPHSNTQTRGRDAFNDSFASTKLCASRVRLVSASCARFSGDARRAVLIHGTIYAI